MRDHALDSGRKIRVATYNIHSGIGRDGRCDPARTAAVLAEIDADIVALQEVDSRLRGGRDIDQFEFLERASGLHAVPGPNIVEHQGQYGNALLSRWPLRAPVLHRLNVGKREPRGAIEAELDWDGPEFVVFATHLGLKPGERRHQIDELARLLRARAETPTVMMGDFNVLGPHAGALGRLGHPLGLRLRAPATFPSRRPFIALDRIWCLPSTLRLSVRVHSSALSRIASDHLPLVAEVAVSGG